ncbi:MAG: glycosyl transferase [Deltaproteobacteria bacterium CG11_big_fil_rev_8_21_14_0_20_45_16]|nr:MAG: glycosyl transferase [Deltaproteobacteria bacterium CG11_big_fil_rev_8_21_14_0_20_45_16]
MGTGSYRICHLTTVHWATDSRIFHKEARTLYKAGYEVHICGVHPRSETIEGVHIHGLKPFDSRWNRLLFGPLKILIEALKIKAHVYHIHDPELLILVAPLRLIGKRVIFDSHEDIPCQIYIKDYLHPQIRGILAFGARSVLAIAKRISSHIVAATEGVAQSFGSSSRITVIKNYPDLSKIDINLLNRPYPTRKNWIVYAGLISDKRGIFDYLDAFQQIEHQDAELVLLGRLYPDDILDKLKHHPRSNRIQYLGEVNHDEVFRVLLESKIGLVCLHPTGTYETSLPIKMFEYMSCGLPLICSDFELWREILDKAKAGILVRPKSPTQIAEAIDYLLNNPNKASEMGASGRNYVDKIANWEIEGKKLVSTYQRLS